MKKSTPLLLFMHELFLGPSAGGIGLKASAFAPAWFSEFRYQRQQAPRLKGTPITPAPPVEGTVLQWNVSNTFDESALTGHDRLDEASLDLIQA